MKQKAQCSHIFFRFPSFSIINISFILYLIQLINQHWWTTWPKATWDERVYFIFNFLAVHHWEKSRQELKQARNLKAETEVEAIEESCFLTFLLSYSSQDHHCRCGTVHSEWALPHQLPIMKLCHRLAHRPTWMFPLPTWL